MPVELAVGLVQLVPSARGFNTAVENQLSAPLTQVGRQAGENISRGLSAGFAAASTRLGKTATTVGRSLTVGLSAPLAVVGGLAVKTAIDFESAFAGVRKTVDATAPELDRLRSGIIAMSRELPATTTEIAGVAEAAGQLGIETPNILGFTRTMIDLGETTNLSAQDAAQALARLANITQLPQDQFDRLGSAVVDLGNKSAATEAEIVEFGLRIAGAGQQIGLSEAEILGFGTALASVGIEAEAGGTAISRVFVELQKAVNQGGADLDRFASVAGVSSTEFKRAFEQDAAGAIITFIEGLGNISDAGGDVFTVLEDLSLADIRVRDALLRASGAGDLFRQSIEVGSTAWRENTALTNEAAQRYDTTAAKLEIMRNKVADAGRQIGEVLIPVVTAGASVVGFLADKIAAASAVFESFPSPLKAFTGGLLGVAVVAGPVVFALGKIASGIGAVTRGVGNVANQFRLFQVGLRGFSLQGLGAANQIGGMIAQFGGLRAATSSLIAVTAVAAVGFTAARRDARDYAEALASAREEVQRGGTAIEQMTAKVKDASFQQRIFDHDIRAAEQALNEYNDEVEAFDKVTNAAAAAQRDYENLLASGTATAEELAAAEERVTETAAAQARVQSQVSKVVADAQKETLGSAQAFDFLNSASARAAAGLRNVGANADATTGSLIAVGQAAIAAFTAQLDAGDAGSRFASALDDLSGASARASGGVGGSGGAAKTAAQAYFEAADKARALRDAQLAIADNARALEDAQRGVTEALRDVTDAERDLVEVRDDREESLKDLAKAELRLQKILTGDPASKDAADAAEALSDAQLDLRESNLNVAEAEENLRTVRADSTATERDIEEATIRRDRALDRHDDVLAAVTEAERVYNGFLKGFPPTANEVTVAQDNVSAARRDAEAADRRVVDAELAVEEANRQVAVAHLGVEEAQRTSEDAALDLARAQADVRGELESVSGAAGGASAALAPYEERLRNATRAGFELAAANTAAAVSMSGLTSETDIAAFTAGTLYSNLQDIVRDNPALRGSLGTIMDDLLQDILDLELGAKNFRGHMEAVFGFGLPGKRPFDALQFLGLEDRHSGGPVVAGRPYVVRPDEELFIPDVDGMVVPSVPMSAGGDTITILGPTEDSLLRALERRDRRKSFLVGHRLRAGVGR